MESTEAVNEVLEAAFRLAASDKKHLLWEIVVREGDYLSHQTSDQDKLCFRDQEQQNQ